MKLPLYQADAFATTLFAGNPAAIVFLPDWLDDSVMQSIALENNLAETAFVVDGKGGCEIRWFTPTVEVDLCGHATLAAAHVMFTERMHGSDTVSFSSRSGPLRVRQGDGLLWLDFPTDSLEKIAVPDGLSDALGILPAEVYRGRDDILAVVDSEQTVASLSPDLTGVATMPSRGVIVTARGDSCDFVSRFFAPQSGIPEDPVTGSAHTTLTPYWSAQLDALQMTARQISPRGGELVCRLRGDRVEIGGNAVTYLTGEINV